MNSRRGRLNWLFFIFVLFPFIIQLGCATKEFYPKKDLPYWYYPKELVQSDRAVEDARKAGKDKECPDEFNKVSKMNDEAFEIYISCRDKEAIAKANEAIEKAKALCPQKPAAVTQTPTPKSALEKPKETATVPGEKPKPSPEHAKPVSKVIDKLNIMVNFDFDKSIIRKVDIPELERAATFIKKYPGAEIVIEGHTCNIGTEKYNHGLSERRAEAVKKWLIKNAGIDKSKISSAGYGELKPIASNRTKEGRTKNRRAVILSISE